MFVGGCAGSTAGGLKVIRILGLCKLVITDVVRLLHPHAVLPVRIGKTKIPEEVLRNILGLFVIFLFIFVASVIVMTMLGMDLLSAFGAVAASLGNSRTRVRQRGPHRQLSASA